MKVIGAFFRFIFFLALLAAVGYNTYEVMQLRAEVEQLKNSPQSTSRAKPSDKNTSEPDAENPRQRIGGNLHEGADGPLAMLQKANSDVQTSSQRTIAALQQRITELTQQMEGTKPQSDNSDNTDAIPHLKKTKTGKKVE